MSTGEARPRAAGSPAAASAALPGAVPGRAHTAPPGPVPPRFAVSGVLLTLGTILVLELLDATPLRLAAPGVALLFVVAYTAYRRGMRDGLVSALLSAGYIYYTSLTPAADNGWFGTPLGRLVFVGGAMVGVAALVGRLRARLDLEIEREREQRHVAEEQEQQLRTVLESMGEGFITLDLKWRVRYVNARAERIVALDRAQMLGRVVWDLFPAAIHSKAHAQLHEAMNTGRAVSFEQEYPPANRWFELRGYPSGDGISVYFRDVTSARRARRLAEQSQRLLADSGAALAATLDAAAMFDSLGRVLVPGFADAVVATLREEDGTLTRLAPITAAPDAAVEAALPAGAETSSLIRRVADENATVVLDGRALGDPIDAVTGPGGYRSGVLVPLSAGGRTRGVLMLLCRDENSFDEPQLRLAQELAHRAGFALDNLRLYESALLANQAKSDFLAVMSHELRTPLTTVMGYTDLMLSGLPEPLPEAAQRYAQRVRMAAWHLLAIIEQILIYTRLEVGTEALQPERISVTDVLHDTAGLIEPVAREKGIEFALRPPSPPIDVETDVTKLRQILLNLLSNAIRFTDQGTVALCAEGDDEFARFIVEDTGIGIAASDLERIFDPFWQVDQSATRRVGGTGLGLSVARRLSRLLGGDIEVTSTPGAGTRFVVVIPRRRPEA